MERVVLHIDMDAFYASVEQRGRPELRGLPVIVGGTSRRGVVSTASYEARKFGIHSAMPIFEAKRRCPQGVFLPVRMERYKEVSSLIMEILNSFSPLVEQVSIDEAYLDVSGVARLYGSPKSIATKIKEEIKKATSLTCSIGIAPNKLLAKIASDTQKPDGLTIIPPDKVHSIVREIDIEKVPGVGRKTCQRLASLGVRKLGDIRKLGEKELLKEIGTFGLKLLDFSKGIDSSPVLPYTEAKSLSSEETLEKDTNNFEVLKRELLSQAEIVGRKLRSNGLKGSTVTLKLKRSDFSLSVKSLGLPRPTNSTELLYRSGVRLLKESDLSEKFRLIGLGVSRLSSIEEGEKQLNLFEILEPEAGSWRAVEKALDTIREKFGDGAIKRGRTLPQTPNE
ncbi:MAG: DNA polymerase IV [Deltaproteobacteria bacterium]|nr:MAG: DNA polymerase IV [Deltaproteobacteria bacterium]